jgi:outer membrane protein TolC
VAGRLRLRREVLAGVDRPVEYHKDRQCREYQEQLAFSALDAAQLSEKCYRGGAASYLEVLTNERII